MKTIIIAAATVMGMTGLAIADEAKGPAVMTDAQMDLVVAGDLTLPNGRVIFENFDNPNTTRGDPFHPGMRGRSRRRPTRQIWGVMETKAHGRHTS
jgi:hypothetical protein